MNTEDEIKQLCSEIQSCQDVLIAIGDEVRQHIILKMIEMNNCSGVRVNDIASKTNLSRPTVSYHLQIMKRAGIVKMRKEGTKNYYYFDADKNSFGNLINMLSHAKKVMESLPDRSGEL